MDKSGPSFSILITVYNQANELRDNLPAYLTQQYEQGYEVIVIDESSSDESPDVLKLLKKDYPRLYSTFLPKPNRQLSRRKLAYNIGLKASHYEWVILLRDCKEITSSQMLQNIADAMDVNAELTLGYFGKKGIRLQAYSSCEEARNHILKAERKLTEVQERKYLGYKMGRYNFIIVHRDHVYELLNYFEQELSFFSLLGTRLSIVWKNMTIPSTSFSLTPDSDQEQEKS